MTLEPLPETVGLANHSSDFSITDSQPAGQTDPFMEVTPRPKNALIAPKY